MRALIAVCVVLWSSAAMAFDPPNENAFWRWNSQATNYADRGAADLAVCQNINASMFVCGAGSHVVSPPATCGANCGFNPAATDAWNPECQLGAGSCAVQTSYYVYQLPRCPLNHTEQGGLCVPNACITNAGKEADFEITWIGAESDPNPTEACIDSCATKISSGARFDVTLANGTRYNAFKGMGVLSATACASSPDSRTGSAVTPWRTVGSGSQNVSGVGGVGSSGGGVTVAGQGFNKTDGLNLAKIASNTAKIAGALGTSGGGTSGGAAVCGAAPLPACEVAVDAGDSEAAIVAGAAAADAQIVGMASGMDVPIASLGSAPTFSSMSLPDSGYWKISFGPFLSVVGEDDCSIEESVSFGPFASPAGVNWCPYVPYIKAFGYWLMAVVTALGIWSTVYVTRS